MSKTVHDIYHLGSISMINNHRYTLNEVMIVGTSKVQYTTLKLSDKNGRSILGNVDLNTNTLFSMSLEQRELYNQFFEAHKNRLLDNKNVEILDYKMYFTKENYLDSIQKIVSQDKVEYALSSLSMNSHNYSIMWYSLLYNRRGDSLIASISSEGMEELSTESLYNDVELSISCQKYNIKYQGTIVRIEKYNEEYLLYIHPYPMEVMQSTIHDHATFESIGDPLVIVDFVANRSDSDIKGVIGPNSDKKPIHDYIIVGIINNINIAIDDCVIGNVRVGTPIDVSEKFKDLTLTLSKESTTIVWVNVESDSLYNAFCTGKEQLITATEFLSFMIKTDMYADWFGTVELSNNVWDIRSHYPQVSLEPIFYVENCILGESITFTDKNKRIPSAIRLDENAEYLFEYDWIESYFCKLQAKDQKLLRMQYALKWIIRAWDAEDPYDKLIHCSMALEFVVNGEKGMNIIDEYAIKSGKDKLTKSRRKELIESITKNIELTEIDKISEDLIPNFNESIKKMIYNKLSESSFGSKLDTLINRLNIPVSNEEKELLTNARQSRNKLIHGHEMVSISTLEVKKLCGITSRILMYKIMNELGEE